MKFRSIAWMSAGLLLAGVAGAAVVSRRKGSRELPAEPVETPDYAELRAVLQRSADYNNALYERLGRLEKIEDPAGRLAAVAEITTQNQADRQEINELREKLQARLGEQGRTFADVEGFADLLSEFRARTLLQQKRHLELYHRVRKLENVPNSPELHAYLRLGFKEEEQRHADTDMQLMKAANEQRELMLRSGRVMDSIVDAATAETASAELVELGASYRKLTETIRLYREDDPKGAEHAVAELRTMYAGLLPMLKSHAARLRENQFFGNAELRAVVERMLPQD